MTRFCKFHGYGNDYLVFAAPDLDDVNSLSDFARAVCDRHLGVGADGVATFEKIVDDAADFAVRIFNPDGSEAGFSGNGTRCAVAHLYENNFWQEHEVRLRLSSGIKKYSLVKKEASKNSPSSYIFAAEVGHPKFDSDSIPMRFANARRDVVDFPFEIAGTMVLATAINVGNPVACVFTEDFDVLDWRKIGASIENRQTFPERTNVVFVKIVDRSNLEIRIWERGAGETSSSGTCSIAAAVVTAYLEKTARRVSVHAPGGTTEVEWRDDDEMILTGRAELAFCGEWRTN